MNRISNKQLYDVLTPVLVLLCPYVYYIQFNQYGFLNFEALALFGICSIVGLIGGWLLYKANWVGRVIVLTVLVTVSLSFFPLFANDWWLKAAFFIMLLLSIYAEQRLSQIIAMISLVFIVTTLFLPMQHQFVKPSQFKHPVTINPQLPTVIHLILDEHVGINAIPKDIPGGEQLKQQITQFYLSHNFQLYPNAYSRYARTFNSIPNLLNFTTQSANIAYFPNGIYNLNLTENASFKLLSDYGYALNIVEPDYINFCSAQHANIESCYIYPVHSPQYVKNLSIGKNQHLMYLAKSFLLISSLYQAVTDGYESYLRPNLARFAINLPHIAWFDDETGPLAVPTALDQLAQTIIAHPQGRVFYAHLLLPHSPYLYDQTCKPIKQVDSWLINYDKGPNGNDADRRALRYREYETQMQCNYQLLGEFFDKLKQAGVYDNAVIIVNGDHSSRIMVNATVPPNIDKLTWQDFQDAYATLFAIKLPQQPAHIHPERQPITYLYTQAIEHITGATIREDKAPPFVYLASMTPLTHDPLELFMLDQFKGTKGICF